MTERPIIMTSESVRAILDGRKTMTRRVMKPQPVVVVHNPSINQDVYKFKHHVWFSDEPAQAAYAPCPYGVPGDRLWVREKFKIGQGRSIVYFDTPSRWAEGMSWKRSIFMPRWASRITLEVVNVRVERITDISDSDCYAEGIVSLQNDILGEPYYSFKDLWDSINAKRGYPWSSNPWVWVIEFRKVKP